MISILRCPVLQSCKRCHIAKKTKKKGDRWGFLDQNETLPPKSLFASPTKDSGAAPFFGPSKLIIRGAPPLIFTYASKAGNSSTTLSTNSTNLLTQSNRQGSFPIDIWRKGDPSENCFRAAFEFKGQAFAAAAR